VTRGWAGTGSTWAWRKLRLRVLDRDRWLCQLRLEGCTRRATTVHHIVGKGISDDMKDLCSACESCNQRIGDPTRADPDPRGSTKWG